MGKKDKRVWVKLIANPGAKQISKDPSVVQQVTQYMMDCGLKVDVAMAHPKRKAIPIVKQAIEDGYDMVIAMGGDGTIGAVIEGVVGSKIKLGIIPAGTSNDFITSLGIPADLKEACDLIVSGQTRKVDVGRLKTKQTKKFYFFMTTIVGLIATLYPDIAEVPEGKFGGIKNAVSTLLKYESAPKIYLTLDDESKIKVESLMVTIVNTPLIGLKNMVAPDAIMDDGLLDIAVYPNWSKAQLLAYFAKTAKEGPPSDEGIQRYRAKKIKIKTDPKLDIAAEGIMMGKGKAKIKAIRRALRVIAPEPGTGTEKHPDEIPTDLPSPVSPISTKQASLTANS